MSKERTTTFSQIAQETTLYPQEELVKTAKSKHSLFIGLPKEVAFQENRIVLTPQAVSLFVNNGHDIWVESGAGEGSKFTDHQYSEAGAKIVYSHEEVLEADIVLKVEPPTLEEITHIHSGKTLISALQLGNQSPNFINALNKKRLTSIGFELIQDKVGGMPVVRAMSEIAGSTVMLIAAEYLSSVNDGKGVILGGITGVPPTKVAILGSGTVAEYAARASLGLGVDIQIFDNHIYKLRRIKHALGHQVFTSTVDPVTLTQAIRQADVLIGAKRSEDGKNRFLVSEEMVAKMKPGSVIIDVSIDQGGCIETSELTNHENPIFLKHGVIHYCVPNIASRVARTATQAFSNIFAPILLQAAEMGGIEEMIYKHNWFMRGVYTFHGSLTNEHIARKFGMKHKDLNLLMAARM